MSTVTLTQEEFEELYSPIGNETAYPELPGVVCDLIAARVDAALARVRALAERYAGQWVPGADPITFDQGVGAAMQDILAALGEVE